LIEGQGSAPGPLPSFSVLSLVASGGTTTPIGICAPFSYQTHYQFGRLS
jgi:hypothetical protein